MYIKEPTQRPLCGKRLQPQV